MALKCEICGKEDAKHQYFDNNGKELYICHSCFRDDIDKTFDEVHDELLKEVNEKYAKAITRDFKKVLSKTKHVRTPDIGELYSRWSKISVLRLLLIRRLINKDSEFSLPTSFAHPVSVEFTDNGSIRLTTFAAYGEIRVAIIEWQLKERSYDFSITTWGNDGEIVVKNDKIPINALQYISDAIEALAGTIGLIARQELARMSEEY